MSGTRPPSTTRWARRRFLAAAGAASVAPAVGCRPTRSPTLPASAGAATLVVVGGAVFTGDRSAPRAEAVAVAGDRVVAVGSRAEIEASAGPATRRIDLQGGTCVPGLTDAHAHLSGLGRALEEVDLRGARSIDDVIARIRKHDPKGAFIQGRGWDQNLWSPAAMPTHDPLSAAFADRPVWLRRVDGHAGWANAALLQQSGIGPGTKAPEGGEILRDADGKPTGVLVDAAMGLVRTPPASAEDVTRHLTAGQAHALQRGLTGVHDMGIGPTEDAAYQALVESGSLSLRVSAYAAESWFRTLAGKRKPTRPGPSDRYALVGVKLYADGALGSRGAAMLAPYSDRPGHRGLLQHDQADLEALATLAMRHGFQAASHAIGDAGNRAVLDAYERAAQAHPREDHRFRVEHCQVVAVEDIARFARGGFVASMQPTHATSDMPWVPARIGPERLAGAYAWQRFLDAGVHLCLGSDFPVERADVTHGLYAAMTRQDPEGRPAAGWLPDQRLTLEQALLGFGSEAAYATHRNDHLGRIAVGYQADLTCFATPLFDVEPAQIRSAAVAATIVGGQVAFEHGS